MTRSTDDRDVTLDAWLAPLPNLKIGSSTPLIARSTIGGEGEIRVRGYGPPGYFGDAAQNARRLTAKDSCELATSE